MFSRSKNPVVFTLSLPFLHHVIGASRKNAHASPRKSYFWTGRPRVNSADCAWLYANWISLCQTAQKIAFGSFNSDASNAAMPALSAEQINNK